MKRYEAKQFKVDWREDMVNWNWAVLWVAGDHRAVAWCMVQSEAEEIAEALNKAGDAKSQG